MTGPMCITLRVCFALHVQLYSVWRTEYLLVMCAGKACGLFAMLVNHFFGHFRDCPLQFEALANRAEGFLLSDDA